MDIQAELVSIGNELLSGRTLNTHACDLGAALGAIGLRLVRDTTVPDDPATIGSAVGEALARTGVVFTSGGLGPTCDDLTRDALAQLLGQRIVPDPKTLEHLKGWYERRNRTLNPVGERQALVLEKAVVLPNSIGAAPGQRLDLPGGKTLFILPGPPNEFNAVLSEQIIPWLREQYADARPDLIRLVHTRGIGESDIVTRLDAAGFHPNGIALGFYPGGGKVEIRLTAHPGNETDLNRCSEMLQALLTGFIDPEGATA